jgi:hypothetical protein
VANSNYTLLYTGANLTITKAPLTVTADNKTMIVNGTVPSLTATLSGFQYSEALATSGVTGLAACTTADGKTIGSFDITCTVGMLAASNYSFGPFVKGKLTVLYAYSGFLQPINDTAHQIGLAESKFKLGSTIPAKFVLKNAQGVVVQQTGNPTFSRSDNRGSCDSNAVPDATEVVTPDAGVVYTWDGSQYHYNWSTKGLKVGEYRIYANLADGTKNYVDICLN